MTADLLTGLSGKKDGSYAGGHFYAPLAGFFDGQQTEAYYNAGAFLCPFDMLLYIPPRPALYAMFGLLHIGSAF